MSIYCTDAAEASVNRRCVLTAGMILAVAALVAPDRVLARTEGDEAAENTFLELSRLLTGRSNLNPQASVRVFGAFASADPTFPSQVARLADFMREHGFTDGANVENSIANGRAIYRKATWAGAWAIPIRPDPVNDLISMSYHTLQRAEIYEQDAQQRCDHEE